MRRLVVLLVLFLPVLARADRRAFTHTYEYQTMAEGQVELEIWNTEARPLDSGGPRAFQLQLEVEYGITSHWDIALYQVLEQATNADPALAEPLHYAETKLETRYRFAERGELPIDSIAYFEVAKLFGEDIVELEAKGIFSRDFGRATAVLNVIAEVVMGHGVETEFEPGWSFGVLYEVSPAFKIGAESFGIYEVEEKELITGLGPSVGWAPTDRFWTAASLGFGLTDETPELTAQFILGLHF